MRMESVSSLGMLCVVWLRASLRWSSDCWVLPHDCITFLTWCFGTVKGFMRLISACSVCCSTLITLTSYSLYQLVVLETQWFETWADLHWWRANWPERWVRFYKFKTQSLVYVSQILFFSPVTTLSFSYGSWTCMHTIYFRCNPLSDKYKGSVFVGVAHKIPTKKAFNCQRGQTIQVKPVVS